MVIAVGVEVTLRAIAVHVLVEFLSTALFQKGLKKPRSIDLAICMAGALSFRFNNQP
jgi:hypothetical protein